MFMQCNKTKTLSFMIGLISLSSLPTIAATLTTDQMPTPVKIEGELGGKISGEAWSSDEIAKTGKIISLFYVDPEEKKLNEALEAAYEAEAFPSEKHASIAIVNMAAAWYPNSMINSQLKEKQAKFPKTTYVKDLKKTLVKEWGLQDDSVNIAVFARDGKPLYVKRGQLNATEIKDLMKLIRSNL